MGIITGHSGAVSFSTDGGKTWTEFPVSSVELSPIVPRPPPDWQPPIKLPRSFSVSFHIRYLRDVWYRYQATAPPWTRLN